MLNGNIVITGGSGTLGHAICRQAAREGWSCKFTILSRSELALSRMKTLYPKHRYVVGDVRDIRSLYATFVGHDGVIHGAAMKRIPECEVHPDECMKTNVEGSYNVILAAQAAGVEWCLGISTDKACAAITTYGASKLLMEGLFNADRWVGINLLLLRYGNVVASNGSVVPLWEQQHKQGLPLTITDRSMTRFWLSPTDAVNLIVERVHTRHTPGVLVSKVKSASIAELAKALFPGCNLLETGLRSVEKIHEDLVSPFEECYDEGKYFWIGTSGCRGTSYTSEKAERLTVEEFRNMLRDAEDLESHMVHK